MAVERGKENAQKMRVTDKEGWLHIFEARAEREGSKFHHAAVPFVCSLRHFVSICSAG